MTMVQEPARPSSKTSKVEGLQNDFAKVGDKRNQTYFLIDGKDSRDYSEGA
jgi:hypothetical protein